MDISCSVTFKRRMVQLTIAVVACIALSHMFTGTPAASSAVPRCTSGHLRLSFVRALGATGHRLWDLALTNVGTTTCRLQGFTGVGLLSRSGGVLPTVVARQTAFPRPAVLVRPGRRAFFTFEFVSRGQCGSRFFTAFGLQVIPPNERHQATPRIHRRIAICSVAVGGPPQVTPLRAGIDL